jgi:hypothetical protein
MASYRIVRTTLKGSLTQSIAPNDVPKPESQARGLGKLTVNGLEWQSGVEKRRADARDMMRVCGWRKSLSD